MVKTELQHTPEARDWSMTLQGVSPENQVKEVFPYSTIDQMIRYFSEYRFPDALTRALQPDFYLNWSQLATSDVQRGLVIGGGKRLKPNISSEADALKDAHAVLLFEGEGQFGTPDYQAHSLSFGLVMPRRQRILALRYEDGQLESFHVSVTQQELYDHSTPQTVKAHPDFPLAFLPLLADNFTFASAVVTPGMVHAANANPTMKQDALIKVVNHPDRRVYFGDFGRLSQEELWFSVDSKANNITVTHVRMRKGRHKLTKELTPPIPQSLQRIA